MRNANLYVISLICVSFFFGGVSRLNGEGGMGSEQDEQMGDGGGGAVKI